MKKEKSAQRIVKLEENITIERLVKIGFVFMITVVFFISGLSVSGQTTSQAKLADNTADRNLKSGARVNPSTLAMEFSMPFMNYPGRSGNSFPVGFSYSSKVWRMNDRFNNYSYQLPYSCNLQYVTQLYPKFGDRNNSGWSSSLVPPIIEEKVQAFNAVGNPHTSEFDDDALNNLFQELIRNYEELMLISSSINGPPPCGWYCADVCIPGSPQGCNGGLCEDWQYNHCSDNPVPGSCGGTNPQPTDIYTVKRVNIRTSDGATHEFRQSDAKIVCGTTQTPCTYDKTGTYLSVDGSGMRLERQSDGNTLFMPNGSQYKFPAASQHFGIDGYRYYYATEYKDGDGNIVRFSEDSVDGQFFVKQTDTLGREIVDPLPQNFGFSPQQVQSKSVSLPGFDTNTQNYGLVWKKLKPPGCEENTSNSCGNGDGVLEDQSQRLYFDAAQTCLGATYIPIDDGNPNSNEYLFPTNGWGLRSCSSWRVEDGGIVTSRRFNPTVLAEISLPNGKKLEFKYNQWGEITKIIHPTGAYEKFEYGQIQGVDGFVDPAYNQTNRGVKKHWIYNADNVLQQKWQYDINYDVNAGKYTLSTTASKADNAEQPGMKTERLLHYRANAGAQFGFDYPLVGMPIEETTKDENGIIRARTLSKWTYTEAVPTGDPNNPAWGVAKRDARPLASISIIIEGDKALATMSENVYQNPDTDSGVPSDASYFARLNVKQTKSYHYKAIDVNLARTGTFDQIDDYFLNQTPATIGETTYQYDADYKARGIASLPFESRVINPNDSNPNTNVLAKTQTIFDESGYLIDDNVTLTGNLATTWIDPNTDYRAKPTTAKVWNKDTNTWIQTHTQFDQFGNVRKVWDASGDVARFAETEYSSTYGFAYPTRIITPAPDLNDTTGTSATSQVVMTYDFTTGLPLTVTDDFGQTVKTEYVDSLLRPTRVLGIAPFVIPISETIYDDTNLTVKVKKQIDETNWAEATTYLDSFGRTKKTRAKDSNGDVVTESQYDLLSRVKQVSNPYRVDANENPTETVYWTSSSYDTSGRLKFVTSPDNAVVETNYDLATTGTEIGTVTTVIDQAEKQRRSVTNALGQLIRVDEPSISHNDQLGEIDAPNQPTKYEYDGLNNLKKVIQDIQERNFSYDSLKRLKSATNPESGMITYNYDANSNLTSKTDARGITTNYFYDRINRIIKRTYANESGYQTPQVEYFYDGKGLAQTGTFTKGKLTKVTSAVSTTEYTNFDSLGKLLSHQQTTDGNTYATSYVYNLSGAVLEETYPSGRVVKNTLDQDGSLQQVQGKKVNDTFKNYANSFNYTAAGAVSSMRLGNGRWENMQFNSRLQPTQIGLGTSATNQSLLKLNYEYGELNLGTGQVIAGTNNGNIAKQTITVQNTPQATGFSATHYYGYDSLNRIKIASENLTPNGGAMYNSWKQTFTYDRYGNRRFDTANNNTTTLDANCTEAICNPQISTANNRLIGTSYDNAGNTTTDASGKTFTYDGENKQIKVQNGATIVGEYFYDGDGKRVKKLVPNTGEITIFIYDASDKMVAEYSTIVAPQSEAKISYLTNDHLQSPRIITDQNGTIVSRRDFMPFGEEIARTNYGNDSIREKFATYERDAESNLDFAQARMYTNKLGRFSNSDPYNIVLEVQYEQNKKKALFKLNQYLIECQQWNRFSYAINNPLKYIDPAGEVIYLTGTAAEQKAALKRLESLLGEERMRQVTITYKNVDGIGAVTELSFLSERNAKKMDSIGRGDEGVFSIRMSDIIGSSEIVEYRLAETFTNKDGTVEKVSSYGGAATINKSDSPTGNIQIFVHPTKAISIVESRFNNVIGAAYSDDGGALYFSNETIDAHEFGHAHEGINGGKVNSSEGQTKSLQMENTVRERQKGNLGPRKRKLH